MQIALYPGASAHEAMGALAACHAAGLRAELVAEDALVQTLEGARVVPTRLGYAALGDAEAVVLPHGDSKRALADASLIKALRARRGKWLLASGDGIHIATGAGLTEGRRVAVLPGHAPPPGATAQHARLVADARLLTSFPGDALIDLVLHYVGRTQGDATAARAADVMGREQRRFALGAAETD